ncbi:hypothetical protein ACFQMB_06945 [Pseudobowmanella zhangzhouensis]|uniref:hypothetical protein n=1 Tax=Pseudobowmanella zhangzhouensis TaxID=1537679 RepID=UPI00361A2ADE
MKIRHHAKLPIFAVLALLSVFPSQVSTLEQAKRMHDRLAGVPADNATLQQMADLIELGDTQQAAQIAMQNPAFYRTTLKNWITPWTNEDADIFQPLNDYSATVIGMIRDDVDFRLILSGDILYTGASNLNLLKRILATTMPTMKHWKSANSTCKLHWCGKHSRPLPACQPRRRLAS